MSPLELLNIGGDLATPVLLLGIFYRLGVIGAAHREFERRIGVLEARRATQ